nr:histone deacetylase 14 [Tanacetum cinerariifolium]
RKHRFHPRLDSPLHLSNEEPVLGYLKFSTKGTKREIFGIPIPRKLITANIREAPYYQEYQENVAKHRGFLADETGSTQDLPAPKLAKPARKPQSTTQKAPLKPSISSSVTSTQPAPTSVAHDLLSLQKYKKTSPADQYIFQSDEKSEKIVLGVEKGGQDEDFSFGDQFFSDKPSDDDKSAKTEVESMVNVLIQQALSSISLITSPIIDLTSRPESPKEHQQLKATTTDTTTTTTIMLPPPQAPQQSTIEAMMVKRISELEHTLADLIQVNKTMEERDLPEADMKEILHQCMWEFDSYKSHEDHMQLFEALEKSINCDHSEELTHDLAKVRKKRKKGRESPKMPPGSPSH